MLEPIEQSHQDFITRVLDNNLPRLDGGSLGNKETCISIFRAQVTSRQIDRIARKMQKAGQGFYTIGSAGHEGMAAVAHALRPTDMAFLHYRDGAFQIARASQVPNQTPVRDILLSLAAAKADPISGGRHKVLGSKALAIPPQTSTIASHLPKAVGAAFSIGLAAKIKPEHIELPTDSIIFCSFGDASLNHSTAQGALNTASWTSFQDMSMPILFTCEDNGIGISTKTPSGWVAASVMSRPGLKYFHTDGMNLGDTIKVSREAARYVRTTRRPAFLHIKTQRLFGHAGSDVEQSYLSHKEISDGRERDPLLYSAQLLLENDILTADQIVDIYNDITHEVEAESKQVMNEPKLEDATDVMQAIVPPVRKNREVNVDERVRVKAFGLDYKLLNSPQPMAKLINWALTDLMFECPEIVLVGEDIGPKGGVYGVTQKLYNRFGPSRVINTVLDEQTILGLSIGLAHNGLLPIPEIQFLAYLHNAEDQLRGEAATLPFFSNGQFSNPMVIRIAGLGYQKGFGGHFHNDNSLAVLRDIPGIIVACPSDGAEAVKMLREAVRLARDEQRVVVFIEPIALYPMRDMMQAGDGEWMRHYPDVGDRARLGSIHEIGDGKDITIITYGNGTYLSSIAAENMRIKKDINAKILDIRWISPLPDKAILDGIVKDTPILIVDECRRSAGGPSEAIMALLMEHGIMDVARLTALDSFIATGPAYGSTLPSSDQIFEMACDLCLT